MAAQPPSEITYSSYLTLEQLLTAQHPLSEEHDELLFVIIHQAAELWLKLALHEMRAARRMIAADELPRALKMLSRVTRIQMQLVQSWDVLATMTPADYLSFRDHLGTGSGFQSVQYRLVEFVMGAKNAEMADYHAQSPWAAELRGELEVPSLYDEALRLLARRGFAIPQDRLERDFTQTYAASAAVEDAWKKIYLGANDYWDLYELAERLLDLEYKFQQWRFGHLKTVERIIGFKRGTGNTSGVAYLEKVVAHTFFPELLSVRTTL
jgi:tryptophan 2,3-dioxygenase